MTTAIPRWRADLEAERAVEAAHLLVFAGPAYLRPSMEMRARQATNRIEAIDRRLVELDAEEERLR